MIQLNQMEKSFMLKRVVMVNERLANQNYQLQEARYNDFGSEKNVRRLIVR